VLKVPLNTNQPISAGVA